MISAFAKDSLMFRMSHEGLSAQDLTRELAPVLNALIVDKFVVGHGMWGWVLNSAGREYLSEL